MQNLDFGPGGKGWGVGVRVLVCVCVRGGLPGLGGGDRLDNPVWLAKGKYIDIYDVFRNAGSQYILQQNPLDFGAFQMLGS